MKSIIKSKKEKFKKSRYEYLRCIYIGKELHYSDFIINYGSTGYIRMSGDTGGFFYPDMTKEYTENHHAKYRGFIEMPSVIVLENEVFFTIKPNKESNLFPCSVN